MSTRRRMTVAGPAARLILVYSLVAPAPLARAQAVTAPDDPVGAITQRTAAARLLAEMGPNTPIDTKVTRLIDRLVLRDRDQVQAAVTALTMLGQPAVPAIIRRIDDRRDMPVGAISFENRAVDAFEGVRHLAVGKVVDGLNLVLNDITGEFIDAVDEFRLDRPEVDAQRDAIVAGWRSSLARRNATPPVPGKSLPIDPAS